MTDDRGTAVLAADLRRGRRHRRGRAGHRSSTEVTQPAVTDLLVFSHGWNNDQATARTLYDRLLRRAGRPAGRRAPTARSRSVSSACSGRRSAGPTSRSPTSRPAPGPVRPAAGGAAGRGRCGDRGRRRTDARRRDRWPSCRSCSRPRRQPEPDGRSCSPASRRRRGAWPSSTTVLDAFSRPGRRVDDDDGEGSSERRAAADARPTTRPTCSGATADRCARAASRSTTAEAARRGSATRLHGLARRQGGAAPGDVLADEEPGRRRRTQRARAVPRRSRPPTPASASTWSGTASAPGWSPTPWPGCPPARHR